MVETTEGTLACLVYTTRWEMADAFSCQSHSSARIRRLEIANAILCELLAVVWRVRTWRRSRAFAPSASRRCVIPVSRKISINDLPMPADICGVLHVYF